MSINSAQQLETTRTKLGLLQDACAEVKNHPGANTYVDELTLGSLQSQIKQLQEEIALYEIRLRTPAPAP